MPLIIVKLFLSLSFAVSALHHTDVDAARTTHAARVQPTDSGLPHPKPVHHA